MHAKQQQLEAFYEEKFYKNDVITSLSSPYLISLEVQNQNPNVMIVGQETNEWFYDWEAFKRIGVQAQMKVYKDYHDNHKEHNRLYFAYAKHVMGSNEMVPVFNNMFKFDLGDKSKTKNISNASDEQLKELLDFHKGILAKEIEIIQPKIILFFTGHVYDKLFIDPIIKQEGDYRKLYKKIDALSVDEWKCCHLDLKHFPGFENFNGIAFRTYHPMYLNRKANTYGKEILDYLKQQVASVI